MFGLWRLMGVLRGIEIYCVRLLGVMCYVLCFRLLGL